MGLPLIDGVTGLRQHKLNPFLPKLWFFYILCFDTYTKDTAIMVAITPAQSPLLQVSSL